MKVRYKGKDIEIQLANTSYDHDHWYGAYIRSAYYSDSGDDVPEEVIQEMEQSSDMERWIIDYISFN